MLRGALLLRARGQVALQQRRSAAANSFGLLSKGSRLISSSSENTESDANNDDDAKVAPSAPPLPSRRRQRTRSSGNLGAHGRLRFQLPKHLNSARNINTKNQDQQNNNNSNSSNRNRNNGSENNNNDENEQEEDEEEGEGEEEGEAVAALGSLQLVKPRAPFSPVLALPISRRPLFPGFYKTVVVKDASVIKAIYAALRARQPYLVATMLKDPDSDKDVITSEKEVHDVGVFCEISSVFSAAAAAAATSGAQDTASIAGGEDGEEKEKEEKGTSSKVAPLTVVLYPLHRMKLNGLITGLQEQTEKSPHSFLLRKANTAKDAVAVPLATGTWMKDLKYKTSNPVLRALSNEIVAVLKDIASLNPIFRDQVAAFSVTPAAATIFDDPGRLADFAAAVSGAPEPSELQEILETLEIENRLQKALLLLKKELVNAELQSKISKDIESRISKRQKEFYLLEQMRAIKRELGMDAAGDLGKDRVLEKFRTRIENLTSKEQEVGLKLDETVKAVIDEEMQKLGSLDPQSSEFGVSRNYLDWLTSLPWTKMTKESFDLQNARKVLDEDHYGMQEVKDRVLEFIAVTKLREGKAMGKIICLNGPPGVGKTSIGKSIARALGRQFYRFSVGGLADVAEIKGHRRTYVGAMPGKLIQALKKVQTANPVILIDEIDKLGRLGHGPSGAGGGSGGDIASAILEVLDPEQNEAFLDHYLDVPVNLSRVLFMCTSNAIEYVPGPLRDRMEVINVSGYVAHEKLRIAQDYLVPQALDGAGLKKELVKFEPNALDLLIAQYCRESGVRSLKKKIEKIARKLALEVVTRSEQTENAKIDDKIQVTQDSLPKLVGKPPYGAEELLYVTPPPGIVTGVAWTALGGATLHVESVLERAPATSSADAGKKALALPSPGSMRVTGQLGDVMKESSEIALTFVKVYLADKKSNQDAVAKLLESRVHMHVPDGATPKDGPSAGITMATALISLLTGAKVDPKIGMTGELTVTGRVLKIGGLKEKVIAARRAGVHTIIFPRANEADWTELPADIVSGIRPVMVETYDQVYNECFNQQAIQTIQ